MPGTSPDFFSWGAYVTGINNAGDVIGTYDNALSGEGSVFSWQPGTTLPTPLPGLGYSNFSGAINGTGQAVGYAYGVPGDGATHAVLWQAGQASDLVPAGVPLNATLRGIDDSGLMAGNLADGSAFTWSPGTGVNKLGDLGTGAPLVQVNAINNAGLLAGIAWTNGGTTRTAFLWQSGQGPTFLAAVSGTTGTEAWGLNNQGQAVGNSGGGPVLWSPGLSPVDLHNVQGGNFLSQVYAINDQGQIAGSIVANGGPQHAAVLTPTGTLSWIGGHGNSFADSLNWDSGLGIAPNRMLDVVIDDGGAVTAGVSADATVLSLSLGRIDGGGPCYGGGSLNLGGGSTVTALNGVNLCGGTLSGSGTLISGSAAAPGSITNHGTVSATALSLPGGLVNLGTVTGNGQLSTNLVNIAVLSVGPGQSLSLIGTQHSSQGLIQVQGGALHIQGALTNQITDPDSGGMLFGTVSVGNGLLRLDQGISGGVVQVGNAGQVLAHGNVNIASLHVAAGGAWAGDAAISLSNGNIAIDSGASLQAATLTVYGGLLTVDGTLDTGVGVTTRLLGGTLNGNGRINGDVFTGGGYGSASFKPGHSPGSFTINGALTLGAKGELELQVEREGDGSLAWDHVAASSISFLAGSQVHFIVGSGVATSEALNLSFLDCGSGCSFDPAVSFVIDGAPGASVQFGPGGLELSIAPVQAVPEPGHGALLAAGLLLLGLRRTASISNS